MQFLWSAAIGWLIGTSIYLVCRYFHRRAPTEVPPAVDYTALINAGAGYTGIPGVAIAPREFRLLTIAGQPAYDLPESETPVRRVDECWVDLGPQRYALQAINRTDGPRLGAAMRATPTVFWVDDNQIHLWPTPVREYRVGFVEHNREDRVGQAFAPGLYAYVGRDFGKQNNKAHKKSIELLKEWLTPGQLQQFEAHDYFDVVGSDSGKTYRINGDRMSFNVVEMSKWTNKPKQRLCFQPANAWSQGDVMLAQKISLERDESAALRIANKSPI